MYKLSSITEIGDAGQKVQLRKLSDISVADDEFISDDERTLLQLDFGLEQHACVRSPWLPRSAAVSSSVC